MQPSSTSVVIQERVSAFQTLREIVAKNTALVELTSEAQHARGHRSWVWDASAMPAGGHYFPVFTHILEELERAEGIRPDTHVLVEATTGSAGMALGWIAKKLGYRIVLFMPEDMPERRIEAVRANLPSGSELKLTAAGQYVGGVVRALRKFAIEHRDGYQDKKTCLVDHSRRPETVSAIAAVVLRALGRLPCDGQIDCAVAALGNGTSATALFRAVRQQYPAARRIGVEPIEAPSAFVKKYGEEELFRRYGRVAYPRQHALLGTGGWGVSFPFLDVAAIDDILPLSSAEWQRAQQALAERGFDVGNSSAACQVAVNMLAEKSQRPTGFFSIIYDRFSAY
jgi:cysteine synthase A